MRLTEAFLLIQAYFGCSPQQVARLDYWDIIHMGEDIKRSVNETRPFSCLISNEPITMILR